MRLEPTNSPNKLIAIQSKLSDKPMRGWQPSADDLIATDWVVLGKDEWKVSDKAVN